MPKPSRRNLLALCALPVIAAVLITTWAHVQATTTAPTTVTVSAATPVFTPRVALAQPGQAVVFTNSSDQDLHVRTTPHNPASFQIDVPAGGSARLTLTRPGLYHFYDAATAHVIDYQADNDVVHTLPGAPDAVLPDQGWLFVPGPGGVPADQRIMVPSSHDLMAPRVAVVRVGGSVLFHNHDTDAHNLVTDPADPAGAAFELLGTDGEPALGGAERRITFTVPGLYHVYCSIHARIVGRVGGWQVVVPRDTDATGFADGDPMESWVLVLS